MRLVGAPAEGIAAYLSTDDIWWTADLSVAAVLRLANILDSGATSSCADNLVAWATHVSILADVVRVSATNSSAADDVVRAAETFLPAGGSRWTTLAEARFLVLAAADAVLAERVLGAAVPETEIPPFLTTDAPGPTGLVFFATRAFAACLAVATATVRFVAATGHRTAFVLIAAFDAFLLDLDASRNAKQGAAGKAPGQGKVALSVAKEAIVARRLTDDRAPEGQRGDFG